MEGYLKIAGMLKDKHYMNLDYKNAARLYPRARDVLWQMGYDIQ